MVEYEYALPIALLVVFFLLKLLIDRDVSFLTLIDSLIELPVDIAFISVSFIVAYIISKVELIPSSLLLLLFYIIGSLIVVLLWRRSKKLFDISRYILFVVLVVINFGLSIYGLMKSIELVGG